MTPLRTVGLVVFPGLASSTYIPYEYDCLSSPSVQILQYSNTSALYAIIGLSSDYRTSDASGLNGRTSILVQSVDWADGRTDGCTSSHYGLENPGGAGSSFKEAINAAQTTLTNTARTTSTHVIIFLSDGDAGQGTTPCHAAITALICSRSSGRTG